MRDRGSLPLISLSHPRGTLTLMVTAEHLDKDEHPDKREAERFTHLARTTINRRARLGVSYRVKLRGRDSNSQPSG
jgi:hypothetical protein